MMRKPMFHALLMKSIDSPAMKRALPELELANSCRNDEQRTDKRRSCPADSGNKQNDRR